MFGGGGIIRLIGLLTFCTRAFALGGAATRTFLEGGVLLPCVGVPTATSPLLVLAIVFFAAELKGEPLPCSLVGGDTGAPGGGGGGLLAGYFGLRSPEVA